MDEDWGAGRTVCEAEGLVALGIDSCPSVTLAHHRCKHSPHPKHITT